MVKVFLPWIWIASKCKKIILVKKGRIALFQGIISWFEVFYGYSLIFSLIFTHYNWFRNSNILWNIWIIEAISKINHFLLARMVSPFSLQCLSFAPFLIRSLSQKFWNPMLQSIGGRELVDKCKSCSLKELKSDPVL